MEGGSEIQIERGIFGFEDRPQAKFIRPWGAWVRLWKEGVRVRLQGGLWGSKDRPTLEIRKALGSLDQIVEEG